MRHDISSSEFCFVNFLGVYSKQKMIENLKKFNQQAKFRDLILLIYFLSLGDNIEMEELIDMLNRAKHELVTSCETKL